ncbi:MAG TPA: cell envelope integrity protein TolA [Ramlibacter sp.]|nr:cell envelope integrity protein TolA [Ramlibacter sp.]
MSHALDRIDLGPPPQPGLTRAFILAVIAHALLLAAFTVGLKWKTESSQLVAEAELWSATAQQAAPRAVEAPPPPPPPPAPVVREQPPPAPTRSNADIALEREKQRAAEEKKRQQDIERERQRRAEIDKAEKAEKAEAARKLAADRKRLDEQKERQAAQAREREQQAARTRDREREQQATRRMEQQREENLRRMQGLAGATGAPSATGTAQRSAGPSDSYAGRIRARVKPNIVFTDDLPSNPTTEVEVRMSPDGTITSRRITKASGVKSWDEAVLRALDRTEMLPRDVDGRVHSPLFMEFRPKG